MVVFSFTTLTDSFSAATNRLITAKDHASVQINIGLVDENGHIIPGEHITYALCGFVRTRSESDDCINRLATKDGLLEGYDSVSVQKTFIRRAFWLTSQCMELSKIGQGLKDAFIMFIGHSIEGILSP